MPEWSRCRQCHADEMEEEAEEKEGQEDAKEDEAEAEDYMEASAAVAQ